MKRNNLLFYGLMEQPTETNEDLVKQISQEGVHQYMEERN